MRTFIGYSKNDTAITASSVTLPYDLRKKTRQRVILDNGEEVALKLNRGILMRGGDVLSDEQGLQVSVIAAQEKVSTAFADDPWLLCRAAYHLGNRHVPLQIGKGWVRFQYDHVLDELLLQLGLQIEVAEFPFEPEDGAFAKGLGMHHHHHE